MRSAGSGLVLFSRRWKVIAKERTQAIAAAEAAAAEEDTVTKGDGEQEVAGGRDGDVGASGQGAAARTTGFPASIVKRIMCLDEEVDRWAPTYRAR